MEDSYSSRQAAMREAEAAYSRANRQRVETSLATSIARCYVKNDFLFADSLLKNASKHKREIIPSRPWQDAETATGLAAFILDSFEPILNSFTPRISIQGSAERSDVTSSILSKRKKEADDTITDDQWKATTREQTAYLKEFLNQALARFQPKFLAAVKSTVVDPRVFFVVEPNRSGTKFTGPGRIVRNPLNAVSIKIVPAYNAILDQQADLLEDAEYFGFVEYYSKSALATRYGADKIPRNISADTEFEVVQFYSKRSAVEVHYLPSSKHVLYIGALRLHDSEGDPMLPVTQFGMGFLPAINQYASPVTRFAPEIKGYHYYENIEQQTLARGRSFALASRPELPNETHDGGTLNSSLSAIQNANVGDTVAVAHDMKVTAYRTHETAVLDRADKMFYMEKVKSELAVFTAVDGDIDKGTATEHRIQKQYRATRVGTIHQRMDAAIQQIAILLRSAFAVVYSDRKEFGFIRPNGTEVAFWPENFLYADEITAFEEEPDPDVSRRSVVEVLTIVSAQIFPMLTAYYDAPDELADVMAPFLLDSLRKLGQELSSDELQAKRKRAQDAKTKQAPPPQVSAETVPPNVSGT